MRAAIIIARKKGPGSGLDRAGGNVIFGLDRTNAGQLNQNCAAPQ
jgi:hypothetical protein